MSELPVPRPAVPIVVGPYAPEGREVWILTYRGELTDREGSRIRSRRGFEQVVEVLRPSAVCGPFSEQEVYWADDPGRWPEQQ